VSHRAEDKSEANADHKDRNERRRR